MLSLIILLSSHLVIGREGGRGAITSGRKEGVGAGRPRDGGRERERELEISLSPPSLEGRRGNGRAGGRQRERWRYVAVGKVYAGHVASGVV